MSRFIKTFSDRLALTAKLPVPMRIAALGEALAVSSPAEAERIVPELLELAVVPTFDAFHGAVAPAPSIGFMQRHKARTGDLALTQLARSWRQITPELAQAVLSVGENRWTAVLPQLSTDPRTPVRLSLAALVGDAADARVSLVLTAMLHDQNAAVGEQAERSLLLLALALLRAELAADESTARFVSSVTPASLARAAQVGLKGTPAELCETVAEAAVTFGEHRRRGPITAALMLASRHRLRVNAGEPLRAWLANHAHPSHSVLRSAIRWSKVPVARLRALELLHHPHLAVACADRLMRSITPLDHELVLSASHLLARPKRTHRLHGLKATLPRTGPKVPSKVKEDAATLPSPGALCTLSDDARRGLPGFIMQVPCTLAVRHAALETLITDEQPSVRLSAVRAMPVNGVDAFCFDKDPRVAKAAFLRWSSAGTGTQPRPDEGRLLALASRSPHAELRTWAQQDRARADQTTATIQGRLAARFAMTADRFAFTAALRALLTGEDNAGVLQALAVVRSLSLAHEFEPEIINIAASGAPSDQAHRARATAAAMLAHMTTPRAAEIGHTLSEHEDARVRANAVEAIAKLARRGIIAARSKTSLPCVLIEAKSDDHHRVRANAIRAGLAHAATGATPQDVSQMLMDARPMHRLAGIWLAGRVLPVSSRRRSGALPEFVARLAELARHDDDPRVRARAASCTQRLEAGLRINWKRTAISGKAPLATQQPA